MSRGLEGIDDSARRAAVVMEGDGEKLPEGAAPPVAAPSVPANGSASAGERETRSAAATGAAEPADAAGDGEAEATSGAPGEGDGGDGGDGKASAPSRSARRRKRRKAKAKAAAAASVGEAAGAGGAGGGAAGGTAGGSQAAPQLPVPGSGGAGGGGISPAATAQALAAAGVTSGDAAPKKLSRHARKRRNKQIKYQDHVAWCIAQNVLNGDAEIGKLPANRGEVTVEEATEACTIRIRLDPDGDEFSEQVVSPEFAQQCRQKLKEALMPGKTLGGYISLGPTGKPQMLPYNLADFKEGTVGHFILSEHYKLMEATHRRELTLDRHIGPFLVLLSTERTKLAARAEAIDRKFKVKKGMLRHTGQHSIDKLYADIGKLDVAQNALQKDVWAYNTALNHLRSSPAYDAFIQYGKEAFVEVHGHFLPIEDPSATPSFEEMLAQEKAAAAAAGGGGGPPTAESSAGGTATSRGPGALDRPL